jgi:hypothetical protein
LNKELHQLHLELRVARLGDVGGAPRPNELAERGGHQRHLLHALDLQVRVDPVARDRGAADDDPQLPQKVLQHRHRRNAGRA